MPELREVFEMTTKQIEPDLDAWREQEHRQRRANRNRRAAAIALVAVIAIVAGTLIVRSRGDAGTTPAGKPSPTPFDPTVTATANGFVRAFGNFDAGGALRYLADDAIIRLDATSPEELPALLSFWKAMGYEQILTGTCSVTATYAAGAQVRCPFDFHAIRSDEIGLGPYGGSYWELTIRDSEIVIVSQNLETDTFSGEMWEPFAAWIADTYPRDGAVMFNSDYTNFRLTEGSIRLWRQRTKEYVEATA